MGGGGVLGTVLHRRSSSHPAPVRVRRNKSWWVGGGLGTVLHPRSSSHPAPVRVRRNKSWWVGGVGVRYSPPPT